MDAVTALTVPPAEVPSASDIRFEAPGAHWASAFSRLDAGWVREEAARRSGRLVSSGVARTTLVTLRDLTGASAVIGPEQWAIACRADQTMSAQELAWRCGLALYETCECVAELARSGLCALVPAASALPPLPIRRRTGPRSAGGAPLVLPAPRAPATWPQHAGAERGAGAVPPRPRQGEAARAQPADAAARPGEAAVPGAGLPEAAVPGAAESVPAASELLSRVLDGLRKLS